MPKMDITKRCNFPVLGGYTVYVVVTKDMLASRKRLRTKTEDDMSDEFLAVHFYNGNTSWILLPAKCTAGMVAHECWHCVRRMITRLDGELDNEMVAYHIEYMVDKVWELVCKFK